MQKRLQILVGTVMSKYTQNKIVKINWLAEREHFRKSTSSNQTKLIHTKPNSSTPNQTHPYQTELNCTKPNSSIPNRTHPHQTKLIHTKPISTAPNQTHPYQTKPSQTIP